MAFSPAFLITPSLLAGLSLSLVAGPLGALLVWQRMAYLADALAHAAILGMVFSFWMQVPAGLSAFLFSCASGALIWRGLARFRGHEDTLLILFSGGAMSLGLFLMTLWGFSRAHIMGYLAGDLGAIQPTESWMVMGFCLGLAVLLFVLRRPLLAVVVSPTLAQIEGRPVSSLSLGFLVTTFLFVLVGLKWAGSLFMVVCMVCPTLMASFWGRTPYHVMMGSSVCGGLSFMLGFHIVSLYHTPLGASVGLVLVGGVALSWALARLWPEGVQQRKAAL
ncbi:metal ABC transporter permease [Candidatus Hepatobacter penaei]|uniref:metal ABC transporter permease n=1 Tax=Candidatus Hepatobacter penaei TaxID=1274402 RepID=UPI0004F35594|nr:metal ABC transporter permease [Candidatus Hepatobacter penaei]